MGKGTALKKMRTVPMEGAEGMTRERNGEKGQNEERVFWGES